MLSSLPVNPAQRRAWARASAPRPARAPRAPSARPAAAHSRTPDQQLHRLFSLGLKLFKSSSSRKTAQKTLSKSRLPMSHGSEKLNLLKNTSFYYYETILGTR